MLSSKFGPRTESDHSFYSGLSISMALAPPKMYLDGGPYKPPNSGDCVIYCNRLRLSGYKLLQMLI